MTRPPDRHLDGDELDALVRLRAQSVSATKIPEGDLREALRHVESCQDCARKLRKHESLQDQIFLRARSGQVSETSNCSDEMEWVAVAAGTFDEAETKERMKHAAQCGHCGPLLKAAVNILSDQTTAEEDAELGELSSARLAWQKQMARKLRNASEPGESVISFWKSLLYWPRPAFAVAALAVIVVAAWVGVRTLRPLSADRLLAQAYTERRSMEVRIRGAKYAPVRVERGSTDSSFDRPEALLNAEAIIGKHLRETPNDPQWLDAKARADLLDGNNEDAIKSLQRAQESQPESPQLLTDLGAAYYQRARAADRPIDYGNAIEALGKALAKNPNDPIALFNRALASEQMFLYTQAIDDWQHYLRLDPEGEWAEEARKHLQDVQQKLDQHNRSMAEPLLTPKQIATAAANGTELSDQIEKRVEEYLAVATSEWLPEAFPVVASDPDEVRQTRAALDILARVLEEQHGDRWLREMIPPSASSGFAVAVKDLSQSLKANDTGENIEARNRATQAGRLFALEGDIAGELRARVEYMVGSQDAQNGLGCLRSGDGLEERLAARSYPWLRTQFLIERGDCTWISGNLGDVRAFLLRASEEAERSGYRAHYLRTQDHLSLLSAEEGDLVSGWARTQKALPRFWTGSYPAMRGYNLYYDRYELASSADQPYLQMAILRDALTFAESFQDNVLRAMAHLHMANAAVEVGSLDLAGAEYARASQLLLTSPKVETTDIARLEADVRIARVEMYRGNTQAAIARLRAKAPEIAEHPTNDLSILYYSTLGEAETRVGNNQEAESALRVAVALASARLRSIHDDKARIEWLGQSSSAYRNLVQQRLLDGDQQGALELWQSFRGAEVNGGAGVFDAPEISQLQAVARRLSNLDTETIVSYALLPRGLAVWMYDNRGVWSRWLNDNPKTIRADVKRFHALCADSKSDLTDLAQSSRSLYQIFFAPIEDRITPGRLLIVDADDELAGLPFEALSDGQHRYLGDRFSIAASRGVYYQRNSRSALPITSSSAAVIAVVPSPTTDVNLPLRPLPDAEAEADTVSSGFASARVLRESHASTSAIASSLPNAELFHFAGHALASAGRSGLVLADSFLTAGELRRIAVPRLRLAVLSACETQDDYQGENRPEDGLVRVFLAAGVPNIVASRWRVDSSATRQFMELFYRSLLGGHSTAESIRQARISLRAQAGMSHPFYWAAFTDFSLI